MTDIIGPVCHGGGKLTMSAAGQRIVPALVASV
jgi:hypothetical protein